MTKILPNSIDTKVFGKTVLEMSEFDTKTDFHSIEAKYVARYDPFYISVKIPSENIEEVHILEDQGFRYIDFQMEIMLFLEHKINTSSFYPYAFDEVQDKESLKRIKEIVNNQKIANRFSADPEMDLKQVIERTHGFIMKSSKSNDEAVYKLYNSATEEIIGYKTHKILDKGTAQIFMSGIDLAYDQPQFSEIADIFHFNALIDLGIKNVITFTSGTSHRDLNTDLRGFNYEIMNSYVVMRKIYS